MRCFFHLVGHGYVLCDESGVDVADVEEARREAAAAAAELAREEPESGGGWSGWRLEAVDACGAVLFIIDLSQVDVDQRAATGHSAAQRRCALPLRARWQEGLVSAGSFPSRTADQDQPHYTNGVRH